MKHKILNFNDVQFIFYFAHSKKPLANPRFSSKGLVIVTLKCTFFLINFEIIFVSVLGIWLYCFGYEYPAFPVLFVDKIMIFPTGLS